VGRWRPQIAHRKTASAGPAFPLWRTAADYVDFTKLVEFGLPAQVAELASVLADEPPGA
jgi:hypothetical protein